MNQLKDNFSKITLVSLFLIVVFVSSVLFCASDQSDEKNLAEVQKLLPEIKTYDYGQSRESLSGLGELVKASLKSGKLKKQVENEIILFLGSDATFAGKQFICEQLSIIGTKEAVPALIKMLSDEKEADIALYALIRISDPEADNALINALPNAAGKTKIGIINTLGRRRCKNAVGDLEKLIYDDNPEMSQAAVAALGKIADISAFETLQAAGSKTTGEIRELILDASLQCADNFFRQGNNSQAVSIYQDIYNSEKLTNIRSAALYGLLQIEKENAVDIIISVLKEENFELQSVAIDFIRELPENMDLKKIIDLCPTLSDKGQIQLLFAFADRGEIAAHQAVLNAAEHKSEDVRIAAFKTLAKIGNESDINLLLRTAAGAKKEERETARQSLALLRGESVNQKILSMIPDADAKMKAELVRTVGERNFINAVPALLNTAVDPDRTVRRESYQALALITAPEAINDIINLLIKEENSIVRKEAEKTLVAVAKKIPDDKNKAESVLNILPSVENGEAKSSLIQVLGRIGDNNALPALRENLKSENRAFQEAAIHGLSAWPNAEPVHDLLDAVKTTNNETNKILALRAYINLLSIGNERTDQESINLYLAAMEQATELNEKRMVISGLANLRSMDALETTAKYLDVKEIQPEAEVAVVRLSGRIREGDKNRIKEILNRVLRITKNSELRERIKNRLKSME